MYNNHTSLNIYRIAYFGGYWLDVGETGSFCLSITNYSFSYNGNRGSRLILFRD